MTKTEYIAETMANAFEDLGVLVDLKVVDDVAAAVETSLDNWGTFNGSDCIPHPLATEVRRVEGLRTQDERDFAKRLEAKDEVIKRLGWDISELQHRLQEARTR